MLLNDAILILQIYIYTNAINYPTDRCKFVIINPTIHDTNITDFCKVVIINPWKYEINPSDYVINPTSYIYSKLYIIGAVLHKTVTIIYLKYIFDYYNNIFLLLLIPEHGKCDNSS